MARPKEAAEPPKPRRPPGKTPESRENQMIALAERLAEEQLIAGTASSQVMTHYLKLGTTRETLEKEKLKMENDFLKAKIDQIASAQNVEKLYKDALNAMRAYGGHQSGDDNDS